MQQKLLSGKKQGLLFILSAPAGTGKTTLVEMLTKEFPCVVESVSFTTRPPRDGEQEGIHYNFVDKTQFDAKIVNHEFLEYVTLYGHYYGTSRSWVELQRANAKHVVLVIDTQGAVQLRKNNIDATYIFVGPPSLDELRRRLTKRASESPEKIEERLTIAQSELEAVRNYDYYILNNDLNVAYQVLRSIVIAEEHRIMN
jgi:guanylate kinase